jgi:hypothetical protein
MGANVWPQKEKKPVERPDTAAVLRLTILLLEVLYLVRQLTT